MDAKFGRPGLFLLESASTKADPRMGLDGAYWTPCWEIHQPRSLHQRRNSATT